MRIPSPAVLLPLALLSVLAATAPALAAPWAEPPFLALDQRLAATCLTASGGDRVAHAQEARGDFDTAHVLRVAPDGALAPDGSVRFGLLTSCPVVATAASGAAVAVAKPNRRGSFVLFAATREPGAAFSAPQPIATARGDDVDDIRAAVAADGAAVVAWVGSRLRGDDYRERLHVVRRPARRRVRAPRRRFSPAPRMPPSTGCPYRRRGPRDRRVGCGRSPERVERGSTWSSAVFGGRALRPAPDA